MRSFSRGEAFIGPVPTPLAQPSTAIARPVGMGGPVSTLVLNIRGCAARQYFCFVGVGELHGTSHIQGPRMY